eukprot:1180443-Prorocentrum_minimum.AAC.1
MSPSRFRDACDALPHDCHVEEDGAIRHARAAQPNVDLQTTAKRHGEQVAIMVLKSPWLSSYWRETPRTLSSYAANTSVYPLQGPTLVNIILHRIGTICLCTSGSSTSSHSGCCEVVTHLPTHQP